MNIAKLTQLLEHDNLAARQKAKQVFNDPLFIPRYATSLRFERELALERLRKISESGIISVFDFERVNLHYMFREELIL